MGIRGASMIEAGGLLVNINDAVNFLWHIRRERVQRSDYVSVVVGSSEHKSVIYGVSASGMSHKRQTVQGSYRAAGQLALLGNLSSLSFLEGCRAELEPFSTSDAMQYLLLGGRESRFWSF